MRALSPIGSSLVLVGAYVFTGGSGSARYMIPGGCIALAGLLMLAVAAVVDPADADQEAEAESARSRRGVNAEVEPADEMDQATASS